MIVVAVVIAAVLVGVVVARVRRRRSAAAPLPVGITYLARPREPRSKRTRVYL